MSIENLIKKNFKKVLNSLQNYLLEDNSMIIGVDLKNDPEIINKEEFNFSDTLIDKMNISGVKPPNFMNTFLLKNNEESIKQRHEDIYLLNRAQQFIFKIKKERDNLRKRKIERIKKRERELENQKEIEEECLHLKKKEQLQIHKEEVSRRIEIQNQRREERNQQKEIIRALEKRKKKLNQNYSKIDCIINYPLNEQNMNEESGGGFQESKSNIKNFSFDNNIPNNLFRRKNINLNLNHHSIIMKESNICLKNNIEKTEKIPSSRNYYLTKKRKIYSKKVMIRNIDGTNPKFLMDTNQLNDINNESERQADKKNEDQQIFYLKNLSKGRIKHKLEIRNSKIQETNSDQHINQENSGIVINHQFKKNSKNLINHNSILNKENEFSL